MIESGWPAPFLHISLDNGLSPGQRWQDELTAAADRCEAVIALISPAWCQAPWCIAELSWAHKLHKTAFGVLIKPTPRELIPSILVNEWQLCDLVQGDERRVIRVGADTPATSVDVSLPLVGLKRLRDGLTKSGLDPQWS